MEIDHLPGIFFFFGFMLVANLYLSMYTFSEMFALYFTHGNMVKMSR